MKMITTFDFRNNLSKYLGEVSSDEISFLVGKFGKPIAVVSPYKASSKLSYKNYFGFLGEGVSGSEHLAKVRRSEDEGARVKKLRSK